MRFRRSLMAICMAVLMVCLPLLGNSGAMLSPMAGVVSINGHAVIAGSAVNAGDAVSINNQGSARLTLPAGSLVAAANTNFKLETVNNATRVRLTFGMVKVSGDTTVALKTRDVVPTSATSRFNVTVLNGPVYVEAVVGSVKIVNGGRSYTVHAGEGATFDDRNPPPATASGAAGGLATPVLIGIVAAAAVVAGVIVHEYHECNGCITSPSQ